MDQKIYNAYVAILKAELVPALGCTEPIAIAYAAAKARDILEGFPESITVSCSGNIIKNVQGVTVPNSGGLKGIEIAAILGTIGGNADKKLEVLSSITAEQIQVAKDLRASRFCTCKLINSKNNLYIRIDANAHFGNATVVVSERHTNISLIKKNGKIIMEKKADNIEEDKYQYNKMLNVKDIIAFADTVYLNDVADIIRRQIEYNTAISDEGLKNAYGAQIGRTLRKLYDNTDVRIRARSAAAAGSDARMSGCTLPVIINSGSGNQGMAVSLPVIEYAKYLGVSDEKLIRALVLANLIALLQKRYIGNLSAFCGAVSAGAGSGCGIAYLHGADEAAISRTLTNTLVGVGGIVCDGAKPSCAAKVASAVEAAIMGFELGTKEGIGFKDGEGLVKKSIEETIQSFGRVGREGMRSTDIEILNIMLER